MDNRLRNHIELEYRYRSYLFPENRLLNEENGHIPGIDKILADIWNSLDQAKLEKGQSQTVPLQTFFLGSGCKCVLDRIPADSNHTGGQSHVDFSLDSSGKLRNLTIRIQLGGFGEAELERGFKATMSHELLHSYEVWHKLKKTSISSTYKGPTRYYNSLERPSYEFAISLLRNPKSKTARALGGVLYLIYPNEQRAFLAELQAELKEKAGELASSRKATEMVEGTIVWRNLQTIKRNLSALSNLQKEKNQELVADACNTYFGRKSTNKYTYKAAIKRLTFEVDSFEQKILKTAGKICVELYESYTLRHLSGFVDVPLGSDNYLLEHLEDENEKL